MSVEIKCSVSSHEHTQENVIHFTNILTQEKKCFTVICDGRIHLCVFPYLGKPWQSI